MHSAQTSCTIIKGSYLLGDVLLSSRQSVNVLPRIRYATPLPEYYLVVHTLLHGRYIFSQYSLLYLLRWSRKP